MTTSHRPQLEARSGAKAAGYTPTSTEHARLLPGHRSIKYRSRKRQRNYLKGDDTEDNKAEDDVDDENKNEDEDSDEEEEEEEDDRDALLLQLEKLKESQDSTEVKKEDITDSEVLRTSSDISPEKDKKSWRRSTTFSRKRINKADKGKTKHKSEYINDITKSNYHQDFLHKFVR